MKSLLSSHVNHIADLHRLHHVVSQLLGLKVAGAQILKCVPEIIFSRLTHDILLLQVTMRRRVNSDTVMITWTPLTVRPTGKCPPPLGVMGPLSVPCHTGKKNALLINAGACLSAAGNAIQLKTTVGD